MAVSSPFPPTIAVLPSDERLTELPWYTLAPPAPVPTSLPPCCVQTSPLRVNTHAAPILLLSSGSPMIAVLPSPERAVELPNSVFRPEGAVSVSITCCVHAPALRVYIQAAPTPVYALGAPTIAVLPSAEIETEPP